MNHSPFWRCQGGLAPRPGDGASPTNRGGEWDKKTLISWLTTLFGPLICDFRSNKPPFSSGIFQLAMFDDRRLPFLATHTVGLLISIQAQKILGTCGYAWAFISHGTIDRFISRARSSSKGVQPLQEGADVHLCYHIVHCSPIKDTENMFVYTCVYGSTYT